MRPFDSQVFQDWMKTDFPDDQSSSLGPGYVPDFIILRDWGIPKSYITRIKEHKCKSYSTGSFTVGFDASCNNEPTIEYFCKKEVALVLYNMGVSILPEYKKEWEAYIEDVEKPPISKALGKRKEISIPEAARLCNVSVSTVEKWERNTRTRPNDYPERDNAVAFKAWVERFRSSKAMIRAARDIKRGKTTDPKILEATAERSVWGEDGEEADQDKIYSESGRALTNEELLADAQREWGRRKD